MPYRVNVDYPRKVQRRIALGRTKAQGLPTSRQERRRRLLVRPTAHEAGYQAVGRGAGCRRQIEGYNSVFKAEWRMGYILVSALRTPHWSGEFRLEECPRSSGALGFSLWLRLCLGKTLNQWITFTSPPISMTATVSPLATSARIPPLGSFPTCRESSTQSQRNRL